MRLFHASGAIIAAAFFIFSIPVVSSATEPKLSRWAAERITTVDDRIKALKARETRATESLKRSKEMVGDFASLDDKGTALLAAGALEVAFHALDGVRVRVKAEEILKSDIELADREGRYMGFAESVGLGVFKKIGDGWQRYESTTLISDGDELKTITAGYIKMLFSDGAAVDMDEKSRMNVGASGYEIFEGRVHAVIDSPVDVAFMVAGLDLSARSAEFDVDLRNSDGVTITVRTGVVNALHNGDKPATIQAGKTVFVKPDGTITAPPQVDPKTILPWW